MITVSSTKPKLGINFPTPISATEIALAQLRVYHNWPNVGSTPFGGLQPNNSFVFSYRDKSDGVPDWNVITLPTGSYQTERITGKEAKISILAYEPTLSAVIEVASPGYAVYIYSSSIRTVLGWPTTASPEIPRPVEPKHPAMSQMIYPRENSMLMDVVLLHLKTITARVYLLILSFQ